MRIFTICDKASVIIFLLLYFFPCKGICDVFFPLKIQLVQLFLFELSGSLLKVVFTFPKNIGQPSFSNTQSVQICFNDMCELCMGLYPHLVRQFTLLKQALLVTLLLYNLLSSYYMAKVIIHF